VGWQLKQTLLMEVAMSLSLKGRIAIVTGGAQGIGQATAERFVEAGAGGVVIADVNGIKAEESAKRIIEKWGSKVLAVTTDVSDEKQVNAMVEKTISQFGRIDILFSNASLCPITVWDDVNLDNWNRMLSVNLTGMMLCTKAVIPHMKAQHYGRIVYTSSSAAFEGSLVAHVAYGVTKAGINALMKSVAKGFAQEGILANSIAPGPIDTPLSHALGEQFWESSERQTLLKRHGSAYEIADVVLFLVSDRASFITGQVLRVDGGMILA
jgi:3-oxoacyl-[acyl-carrier protein] reductase